MGNAMRLGLLMPSILVVVGGLCFYMKNYPRLYRQAFPALLALFAVYFTYNIFLHPLASLPGPLTARLGLPFWQTWQAWRLTYGPALKALHDRYGDTVRIGPNSVSTIDPEAVRTIYAHGSRYTKSNIYTAFQGPGPNIFSQIDVNVHAERRKVLGPVFSKASLFRLEEYVERSISLLTDAFDHKLQQAHMPPVNLSSWLHYFSMDAIGEVTFSQDFSLLRDGKDIHGFLKGLVTSLWLASIASTLPWPYSLLRLPKAVMSMVMDLFSKPSSMIVIMHVMGLVRKRCEQTPDEAEKDGTTQKDMLDQFMELRYKSTGEKWSRNDVQTEAINTMVAGQGSTSVVLTGFFFHILTNPTVYEQLQLEIDKAVDEGRLQFPVSYVQASKLEYFQACIKEALRILPPSGMILDRVIAKGSDGLVIKYEKTRTDSLSNPTLRLPGGTNVGTCPFVFQRSKSVFGEDAEVFRPERWLEADAEELDMMERRILTWGSGPRTCLGKNVAEMEIYKVLPTLLWRYNFSLTPRTGEPDDPHLYPLGLGTNGQLSKDEPWKLGSVFILDIEDFWCNISSRHSPDTV